MPRLLVNNLSEHGVFKDTLPHALPGNAFTDVNNVRFVTSGIESLRPQKPVLTAASVNPLWIQWFPPPSDPNWVYATNTQIWTYTTSLGHTNITRTSGGNYNAVNSVDGLDERWQGGVFQGVGYFNQGMDIPQLWATIAPATPLVNLTNWSTFPTYGSNARAFSMRPYKNFLLSLRVGERTGGQTIWRHPYRIHWSDAALPGTVPTTWAPAPSNFAGLIDIGETPDYIIDGLTFRDVFILYKEKSIWGLQMTEGGEILRPWRISDTIGLLYRDCMANTPIGQVFCTADDICLLDGSQGGITSLLEGSMRNWLFDNLYSARYYTCFMISIPMRKEVWFYFPSAPALYPNRVLIWSWHTRKISLREVNETPFASVGTIKAGSTDTWAVGV